MEIAHYLAILRHRLWLIFLCSLLAGVSAYGVSRKIVPSYDAGATLLVRQSSPDGELSYDNLLAVQQMGQTYSRILVQQPVLSVVLSNLHLDEDIAGISERVRADAMPNTSLIKIGVRDRSAQGAAAIANEIANVFIQQHREREMQYYANMRQTMETQLARLDENIRRLQTQVNVSEGPGRIELAQELAAQQENRSALSSVTAQTQLGEARLSNEVIVVEPAQPPDRPTTPRPILNTIVGAFAGFAIALAIALMAEFSRRGRTSPELGLRSEA